LYDSDDQTADIQSGNITSHNKWTVIIMWNK